MKKEIVEGFKVEDTTEFKGYTLVSRSMYSEKEKRFNYSFQIFVDQGATYYKYAPSLTVDYNYDDPKQTRYVKIQTSALGSLTSEEYQDFMKASQLAYDASLAFARNIKTFIEYHDVVLLSS